MKMRVELGADSYDITVERGALAKAGELFGLNRKVLVVTDDGVPAVYAESVAAQCKEAYTECVPMGEGSKSIDGYTRLLGRMLAEGFTRGDCVVAVGGGVVGDLAGFAASSYMRGIDFYNIPTTMLSQIDSSIGGKTAINFGGVKNIVGAFYQPKGVLIDPQVLATLPARHFAAGMAEAVKMALTSDKELFELIEKGDIEANLDSIIISSLNIKKGIVEKDEKEAGLRRMLNFGHTVGHGIESVAEGRLYHGECVGLGMLPMCSAELKERLIRVLDKLGLPTECNVNTEKVISAIMHDKKFGVSGVTVVKADNAGDGYMQTISAAELKEIAKEFLDGGRQI